MGALLDEIIEVVEMLCETGCISRCINGDEPTTSGLEELKLEVEHAIRNRTLNGCPPVEKSLMYKLLMLLVSLEP